jgi:hypothetical protein
VIEITRTFYRTLMAWARIERRGGAGCNPSPERIE